MRDREKGTAMDYVGHFEREAAAFEAAARRAAGSRAAPAVPSCPEWVVTDLVLHLGMVHRLVARLVGERMQQPPARGDRSWLGLAGEWAGWLPPGRAPRQDPVRPGYCDWFGAGAAQLAERFRAAEPGERVWNLVPRPQRRLLAADAGDRGGRAPGGTRRTRWGRPDPSTRRSLSTR